MKKRASKDANIDIKFLYEGRFYLDGLKQLSYRKNKSYVYKDVDPDMMSKVVLEATVLEDVGVTGVQELWWVLPQQQLHFGTLEILNDRDVTQMMECVGFDRLATVYLVKSGEASPKDLIPNGPPRGFLPSCDIWRSKSPYLNPNMQGPSTQNPSTSKSTLKKRMLCSSSDDSEEEGSLSDESDSVEGSSSDDAEDDDCLGSDSSSDKDYEFEFEDSNGEDDDLFQENVDAEIGEFGSHNKTQGGLDNLDLNLGEYDDNEKFGSESEELASLSDSDGPHLPRYTEFNPLVDFKRKIKLKNGMLFGSNDIFRRALRQFSIENGGDYYYLHNDKSKVSAYCKLKCDCIMKHSRKKCTCGKSLCGFKACARKSGDDGTFQLKSFVPQHDCGWQHQNTKLTSLWLAEKYLEFYRDDPNWKLSAFINAVRRDCNLVITYTQAWRGRFRACLMTQGDARVQYGKVWDYAETIRKWNPGTSAFVKVCLDDPEKPLFMRLYACFDACKRGFLMGCRPIIGLDACHLKGAYKGQFMVAVGKDGNENIYPIAWAVVEAERKETWGWFIEILMRDIGESNPTFMSDRQKGLLEALNDICPMNDTRVCVRHLHNNFKGQWPGKVYKDAIWAAARATTRADFDAPMEEIRMMNEKAYTYLIDSNPNSWSKHAFKTTCKSDILLNNICESFNSMILPSRGLPVLSMFEWIRRHMMKRFVTKREGMMKYQGPYTPAAVKRIDAAKQEALRSCSCIFGGNNTYEVNHYSRTYVVDLGGMSCGCRKWDLTGLPCCHAMCCIMKERKPLTRYIHPFYTKEAYLRAYERVINPMPGEVDWEKSSQPRPEPPEYIAQPGRPRKHRRREVGEEIPSRVRSVRPAGMSKCSHCGQTGHYKNKCSNPPKGPEPPKQHKPGGRPANPKTVIMGSKKRKYTRKERVNEGSSSTVTGMMNNNTSLPQVDLGDQIQVSQVMEAANVQLVVGAQGPVNHVDSITPNTSQQVGTSKKKKAQKFYPERRALSQPIQTRSGLAAALRRSPRKTQKDKATQP